MSEHKSVIPSIVTEDHTLSTPVINEPLLDDDNLSYSPPLSSASMGYSTAHSRSPSDPAFLLPAPILKSHSRRHSVEPLRPPSASSELHIYSDSDDGSVIHVPPSPTLSTQSSVHFASTKALRENRPGDGMTSLHLLAPGDPGQTHRRRLSNSTLTTTDGTTDVDHNIELHSLSHVKSTSISVTSTSPTHVGSGSDIDDDQTALSRSSWKGKERSDLNQKDAIRGQDADEENPHVILDISQDADIDPAPFAFKPFALASLVDPKNLDALEDMGGDIGLLRGLGTDRVRGLSHQGAGEGASQRHDRYLEHNPEAIQVVVTLPDGNEERRTEHEDLKVFSATMETRQRVYGKNVLPERMSKTLLQLMWLAMKDKVLILLSIAAIVSLALGFFQDFGPARVPGQPPVDWVEGVAIIVAILIVVMVGSVNDWQKERQFKVLNEKKEERGVKVIRSGDEMVLDIQDILVGDIAILEPGEIIPCDGVFLSGHNVKCDESGSTGESDAIKKISFDECIALRNLAKEKRAAGGEGTLLHEPSAHKDCFMVSGSKVLEGYGKYVVISVGTKSFNGRIMMALRGDTENTPLQIKLNTLAELIAKIGSLAGLLLFAALMIRFFVQLGTGNPARTPNQSGIAFVNILIISVTLVVVAVPEGLPLAVTLALSFATRRMTEENLLVRVLGSCETMANASVVCTDKTGTLTQNSMTVVAGCIGIHAKFVRNLKENETRTNAPDQQPEPDVERGEDPDPDPNHRQSLVRKHTDDFSLEQGELDTVLSPQLKTLFNEAIAINSTAFEDVDPETGRPQFVGSKTETALLTFAKDLGWDDYRMVRENADIVQMIPFSSDRKTMGVVVRMNSHKFRLHLKGASEILSKKCTRHVVFSRGSDVNAKASMEVETKVIDEIAMDNLSRTIIFYANQTLRTIAICYRDFDSWPPAGTRFESVEEVSYVDLAQDLTLLGITGIEDPLRPGVRDAVASCAKAGVTIKMCTGDNILTARSIALQCGIYSAGGIIMEGPVFRQLTAKDKLDIVPRLQVLARSSPDDKKVLVDTLRSLGEIVGVTGDGTNDGPALKTAHVGFSMGIAGTEVAKEASDIIVMDDNFSSIVKAIMWGRCVNEAVRKFLQFQISTNVTAVIITFVTAVASSHESSVLSAVQLLWINIIMDTFAALALATDPASMALLDKKPDKPTAPLFSVYMIMQIIGQSTYQVIVILIFHFLGLQILGFENTTHNSSIVTTLVFNAFVFAQIFNSVNCRRLDNKLNVFEGVLRNWYFITITLIEICGQVLIVFVGGAAFQVTPIGGREWGISLALGIVSIPLGAAIRLLPTAPFERFFIRVGLMPNDEVIPLTRTDEWNPAIDLVRDNLSTFANVRGGRVRGSSFVFKNRKAKLRGQNPAPFSSLMAMVPTLVASSVGAGWAPKTEGLSDPAQADPSKSSAALWDGKLQFHPDTPPNDSAFIRWGTIAKRI